MPRGLVVLGAGAEINPDQVQAELVQAVREQIGAVAALRTVHVVPGLPKTRSGNMLRKRYMASPTAETNPTLACGPVVAAFTEGCAAVRLGRSRRMPPTIARYLLSVIAEKRGMKATFMPKPFTDRTGSGMHMHLSLWAGDRPLFPRRG